MEKRKVKGSANILKLYRQSNIEAWLTLGLCLFYGVWQCFFLYCFGAADPSEYSFIAGFPLWFFFGCVIGYPLICILLQGVIARFFKDVAFGGSLGDEADLGQAYSEKRPEIL